MLKVVPPAAKSAIVWIAHLYLTCLAGFAALVSEPRTAPTPRALTLPDEGSSAATSSDDELLLLAREVAKDRSIGRLDGGSIVESKEETEEAETDMLVIEPLEIAWVVT
jgi:hypothetical protein